VALMSLTRRHRARLAAVDHQHRLAAEKTDDVDVGGGRGKRQQQENRSE